MSDHVLSLANDSYVREFTILSQSAGVLTVSDGSNLLPAAGNYKWVIRGYPKDEKLQLISYVLHYAILGQEQKAADATTGANS
jgi:hypothetical protein